MAILLFTIPGFVGNILFSFNGTATNFCGEEDV